ncbi:hypothetical protein ACQ4M4_24570 [Leptolyngbya sp. AN02str]|uniref:hypothetical protein n=1 Tax=Leptolyngbya sp. AN02str TaxID=3423363 RepID=UPI003D3112EC
MYLSNSSEVCMMEHCSVAYGWKGKGWNQEITWLRMQGQEVLEWRGKRWPDFLSQMTAERWSLVAAADLNDDAVNENSVVAYFKRAA